MLRVSLFCGFVALSLSVLGCGGGEVSAPTGKVKGVVKYQGQPLSDVNVTFTPTQGRPGTGTTDANGEFTISTFSKGDGAVPGSHKVTVSSTEIVPMPGSEADQAAAPPPFPARYSDLSQTDLTADVKEGETNEFTFELRE